MRFSLCFRLWRPGAVLRLGVLLAASALWGALWLGVPEAQAQDAQAQDAQAQDSETAATENLPRDWQMGFQEPATPVMREVDGFHDFLLYLTGVISLLVLALLVTCVVRFNARRNPEPSATTHNTPLEMIWTLVPALILVAIAVPSFRLLYYAAVTPAADMTIKVTGYQWYWGYAYPDHDGLEFDSLMLEADELQPGQPRLLAVDNPLVVPVDATVRVQITAADVLHSWAVPAFGVKMDAVPGRLNETWFRAERIGTYYGQCSELCGVRHAFMPIEVRVVSPEAFADWLAAARDEFAAQPAPRRHAAAVF